MKASQGASGLTLVSAIVAAIMFFGMVSTSASAAPPPNHKTVWMMKMDNRASKLTVSPNKAMGNLIKAGYQIDAVKSTSIFTAIGNHMTMIRTKFALVFSRILHAVTPGGGNTCR
jgi:hypothetical protein